jgi:2-polyprenyl-3-methyl-5-hydroxy-6-metoxy-1,4-benzoquinol methylase
MSLESGSLRRFLRRTIPVEARSYLRRGGPTDIDQATWDREYAAGEWTKLGKLDEMPRYALVAGYSRTMGSTASVLDVGCGEGRLATWLFQDGQRRYVGVDLSSVAIQQARALVSSEARFEVADATTFDPGDQFDIIVLNEILYYVERPELLLERYEGFLTSRGVFIISMFRVPEALRAWRRVASRLEVLDKVWLRGSRGIEWNVWLCRPRQSLRGNTK